MNKPTQRSQPAPIGLVVEGDAEFKALPLLHKRSLIPSCPPLRVANCGGIGGDVLPQGIAFRVHKLVLGHLVAGCRKVIVCVDREQRDLCAPGLASATAAILRRLLQERGHPEADVAVVVADRAFEAWILADAEGLHARGFLKLRPRPGLFEGRMGSAQGFGKVELKRLLGGSYAETRDGPTLFSRLDFPAAARCGGGHTGSRSLRKLLTELGWVAPT